MYAAMLHHPSAATPTRRRSRLCVSGGAAMPVEVMRGSRSAFGCQVLEGYGLCETSPVASFNRRDRERKPGSIGLPIDGVEMRLVDDEGDELPRRAGRDRHPRPQRHEGLLEAARTRPPRRSTPTAGSARATSPGRRGRLLLHRRPQEGPRHPRRLQRLPARDRGGPLRAPRRARGRRRSASRTTSSARRSAPRSRSRPAPRPRPTSCARSSRSASPPTSTRATSGSSTSSPRARPARSSSARSRPPAVAED